MIDIAHNIAENSDKTIKPLFFVCELSSFFKMNFSLGKV